MLRVRVDRDSVSAGDDTDPHAAVFEIASTASLPELLAAAWHACPLASIAGGRATWLIEAGSPPQRIGVAAQQWPQARLLASTATSAAELFGGREPVLFFRYWLQSDPDAVLRALEAGAALPDKYSV